MKTILLIDDDEDFIAMMQMQLKNWGYNVVAYAEAGSIFKKIEQHKPDLIILDIMLKEFDGREVSRQIKTSKIYRHLPIILISALELDLNDVDGIPGGLFLKKPFQMQALENLLKNILND